MIILYNHILTRILFYIIVFQHMLVFSGLLWFVSGRCANQNQKLCIPGQERKVWYFRLPYHSEGNAGSICHFVACCLCVPASFPIGCHVMSRPISTICPSMCLHLMSRDFTIIHGFEFCLSFIWTCHMTKTMPKQSQNTDPQADDFAEEGAKTMVKVGQPRLRHVTPLAARGHARTKVFEAGEGFAFGETALLYNVWWPRTRGWQPMNNTLSYVSSTVSKLA